MKKFKVPIINGYQDFIRTDNLWLTMNDNDMGVKSYKIFNKKELLICFTRTGRHFDNIEKPSEKLSDIFEYIIQKNIKGSFLYINSKEKFTNISSAPDLTFYIADRENKSVRKLKNHCSGIPFGNDNLLILFKGNLNGILTDILTKITMKKKSISYPMLKNISAGLKANGLPFIPILIIDSTSHQSYEFPIKSSLKTISMAINMIKDRVIQYNTDKLWKIETVLHEALVNAITYGNGPGSKNPLVMNYEIGVKGLRIFVKDNGMGFDVLNTSVPVGREALERISGRGIYIMKKLSDAIFYNRQGNEVVIFFSFV
jgi:serine/threonine-protein kinase RsbW